MDLKAILKANGIEGEAVNIIADAIKSEIPKEFVSKAQYSKKVNLIDELNVTIADLEAKAGADEYKAKYEQAIEEFNNYKLDIENQKIREFKGTTLLNALKSEGFNEKIINLLSKNFDFDKIEIEEGKIKGWEDMVKHYREEYADFIGIETQTGNPPANPPTTGGQGKTYTLETLKGMTAEQIKQNYEAIRKDLA